MMDTMTHRTGATRRTTFTFRLLALYVTLACWLAPVIAWAASKEDEDAEKQEARLEGYAQAVRLAGGGSGLAWAMICFVSVLAIVCLFKNARRTHLD
jgi:hypothetical protein